MNTLFIRLIVLSQQFVDPKRSPTSRSDSLNRLSFPPRWQNQSNMFRQVMLNQVTMTYFEFLILHIHRPKLLN